MIEDGTKFLGVDASVPTPENRSSQANGRSSMVTIEEIAEKIEVINGSAEVQSFLVERDNIIALQKQIDLVNGKNWWTTTNDDGVFTISYNNVDTLWEYYIDESLFATVVSIDNVPPSTTWNLDPSGTIFLSFTEYTGTLQEVIEQLVVEIYNNNNILSGLKSELKASQYTETIVNITSAQILAMGTNPIELLPAAGVNSYYDIDKIIMEFSIGTTPYVFAALDTLRVFGYGVFDADIITSAPFDFSFNPNGKEISPNDIATGQFSFINFPITLSTVSGVNPTLGNGKLRVKIYHKKITFEA
jgi:hypothetical protein